MTIATIRIMPQTEIERRKSMINELELCPLCGSKMDFHHTHGVDHVQRPVVEERSHCPHCACTIQELDHLLQ